MSRKDYEKIAATIQGLQDVIPNANEHWIIAKRFAVMLANENPRFDSEKFMKACGV